MSEEKHARQISVNNTPQLRADLAYAQDAMPLFKNLRTASLISAIVSAYVEDKKDQEL